MEAIFLNKRIKKIRKALELTQQTFANRIGSTQNIIASYESGRRNPSNAVINNICKEFNINEEWLRTGKGEMLDKENLFSLDEFLKKQNATELEIEIVKLIFSFDRETRANLISKLKAVFQPEIIDNEITATEDEPATAVLSANKEEITKTDEYSDMTVKEITEQMAVLEILLKKKQEEKLSAYSAQEDIYKNMV